MTIIVNPSSTVNSKLSLSPAPPRPPKRTGGCGKTLVLNAISAQREKILNEYNAIVGTIARIEPARQLTAQCCRTRQQVVNGVKQEDGKISHVSVFRNACKVHRMNSYVPATFGNKPTRRGVIDHFSSKSRARLKFVAGNCFPLLVSQFCLTYGASNIPADGRETHNHLKRFLDAVRRKYPGSTYLWTLEFQRRGVPHFHVFFSFPPSELKHEWLARKWCKITNGSAGQYVVHRNERNFVSWDMKKGGYLCKYLEKQEQKKVPNNFENVGRFWGCSRNMVPSPDQWFFSDLQKIVIQHTDKVTGEIIGLDIPKLIYRTLRKHHESTIKLCGKKRKSRITKEHLSTVNLPSGGAVVRQLLAWCVREDCKEKGVELF